MEKDIRLFKSKKRNISKENEKNKSLIEVYKNNYDNVLKEKEGLKKEKNKLINEISIIKHNKDNNKNLKLKEKIYNLTKEKKELEDKYKSLQKNTKNKIRANSSLNVFHKQKKFCNLTKIKNKSFIIYSDSKMKEINKRMNSASKTKKFIKLFIDNKFNLIYKNKKKEKENNINYIKEIKELKKNIEENKDHINKLEKEKKEIKYKNNSEINKLSEMVKNLKEKNKKLTEDNNNKNIVEVSKLRIEISKLKMQIYNLNNELEKYKNKEKNQENKINSMNDEFNIDENDNEVHRIYI
jgi:hypothetical protein